MFSYSLTTRVLTVFIPGETPHQIKVDHESPLFRRALEIVTSQDESLKDELLKIFVPLKKIETPHGDFVIKDGEVFWKGKRLHNVAVDRLLELKEMGLPYDSLLNFIRRVLMNPSFQSVNELYNWLANKGLAITPDGMVIGYKAIREDWTDIHSATFNNHPGQVHEMPRNEVDDNQQNNCSAGFHIGNLAYALDFMPSTGHIVLVEFDPADAVSVPTDCSYQKLRVSKYRVIEEYTSKEPLQSPIFEKELPGSWEEDYEEDDEDYNEDYEDDEDEDDEDDDYEEDDEEDDDEEDEDDEEDNYTCSFYNQDLDRKLLSDSSKNYCSHCGTKL